MVESSKRVKPWLQDVTTAAVEAVEKSRWETAHGPVKVTITFRIPRPKSHYGTGANAGKVKPSAPNYPATRPDLDKLTRSTLDALGTAGVFRDDSQAVEIAARKLFVRDGQGPGAFVEVVTA